MVASESHPEDDRESSVPEGPQDEWIESAPEVSDDGYGTRCPVP